MRGQCGGLSSKTYKTDKKQKYKNFFEEWSGVQNSRCCYCRDIEK